MESDVQVQARMIKDERLPQQMAVFRRLMDRAVEQRARRARALTCRPPDRLQFGDVNPAECDDSSRNVEMPPEDQRDSLSIYASDNEDPLPIDLKGVVRPTATFVPVRADPINPIPITSQQPDLRVHLEQARAPASYGARYGHQERDRRNLRGQNRQRPNMGHRDVNVEREFVRTRNPPPFPSSSRAAYVPGPMERLRGPVTHRPYPPFAEKPEPPLVREDPKLIGMSEVFIHPLRTQAKICPICPGGKHKLHQCKTFLCMGLQAKWYTVLKKGVCLNCLIRGHSHLTCKRPGTCTRCGTRHNSKLCPQGPNNL